MPTNDEAAPTTSITVLRFIVFQLHGIERVILALLK
jgi:hypothetical protein